VNIILLFNKTCQILVLLGLFLSCILISGCAKSVEVATEFPTPLVDAYPFTVGIRYPAELTDFVYTEDPELEPEWQIRLGQANVKMFNKLFGAMFAETVELDTDPQVPVPGNVDFVIEPKLEELDFSVPRQSSTDQYVVWLRYNLALLKPDGQLISNWRVTAYGQEDEGNFGMGSETAMQDAAIKALRDTAATIILGFADAPGVKAQILGGNTDNTNDPAKSEVETDALPVSDKAVDANNATDNLPDE
jgi:hypothetical protein